MRKKKLLMIGMSLLMAANIAGCQKKNAGDEATVAESVAASENVSEDYTPVTEETWNNLGETYSMIKYNYDIAKKLLDAGNTDATENPEEIVAEAERLIKYGETCGKEDMTEAAGKDLLYELVNSATDLVGMINQNGGTALTMEEVGALSATDLVATTIAVEDTTNAAVIETQAETPQEAESSEENAEPESVDAEESAAEEAEPAAN